MAVAECVVREDLLASLVNAEGALIECVLPRGARAGNDHDRHDAARVRGAKNRAQRFLGLADLLEVGGESRGQVDTRKWHQLLAVPIHPGVLPHCIHLRNLRFPKVVRDEEFVDRQAARKDVAADEEVQARAEVGQPRGRVDAENLSLADRLAECGQKLSQRRGVRDRPAKLFVGSAERLAVSGAVGVRNALLRLRRCPLMISATCWCCIISGLVCDRNL